MEEIHILTQFTLLKILLLESYQQKSNINRFKRYADKSRASPPVFNPGDMVWLSSKNIKSTRPTKKLSERWLGPFSNLEESQYSCLPPQAPISMEVHPPSFPYFPFGTSQDINNPK
ncbi:hypothetical protein O181_119392 [Austropuccinia psidii MF-1]|uniref:Uncharacterized protein n=1 Tax=Austropuccinia psidii MF-1 TaxID=1389203 RepID=A0A9Q3KH60_9BASI|nr:hypothetical protein [Austropuccinia psidii MF-1]